MSQASARFTGPPDSDIDLSVVIVSHNVVGPLADCLESLRRDCAATDITSEVFVVDNASTDGTPGFVRQSFPQVRLRASAENLGFSAGNNLVLPQCRGRFVMLLNPDTVVHPGALRALMRHLEDHSSVAAVGPMLILRNGRIQTECARNLPRLRDLLPWLLLLDKAEAAIRPRLGAHTTGYFAGFCQLGWDRRDTREVACLCGACLMLRREVVERVGLLDESTALFLDDIDYCRRIRDVKGTLHYVADSRVTHLWQQSSSQLQRDGDIYAAGCHAIWLYLRKHEGLPAAMTFSAMSCFAGVVRVLAAFALSVVTWGSRRTFALRQLNLAMGLCRWAFRVPKSPPRLGFANERRVSTIDPAELAPPVSIP